MIGRTISRPWIIGSLLFLPLISSTISISQEWWETKPYLQWTANQIDKVLNDSPWVGLAEAGIRKVDSAVVVAGCIHRTDGIPVDVSDIASEDSLYCSAYSIPILYRVRLITAMPVREAILRQLASGKRVEPTISMKDYATDTEKNLLERFVATHPSDIRVKGDNQNIIVALTLRVADINNCNPIIGRYRYWVEEPKADELSRIDKSKLIAQTSLATNTNRVALARYEPPDSDCLGAKYYFPRNLSNGAPLIAPGDKDLVFETRINGSRLKVRFNLKKMLYNGKPET
jgi:hypothetical protein